MHTRFDISALTLLAAVVLTSCGATEITATDEATCQDTIGQQVLILVNDLRHTEGLPSLVVDLRLVAAAQKHSGDMASHNFMAHTGSSGSSAQDRIEAENYPWNRWSENVAAGQRTASNVVSSWMNSPGHRANIMGANSKHVGIGFAQEPSSDFQTYWTMNFGATSGDPVSGNGCHP